MDEQFIQQVVNAISLGAIYALFALGYALVFSVLGVLNLAHSAIFSWGAILGLIMMKVLNFPLWVAFPLATIGAGLIGVLLERVAFYPLRRRNAPRISQLISSIGAAILLVNIGQLLMQNTFGNSSDFFPPDLISTEAIAWLPGNISPVRALILVIALVLMVLLQYLVTQTRSGRAMRTVAFDQRIAALLGVDVERVFLLTFFLAGVLGGAAGMLFGLVFRSISPFMGDSVALVGLVAIVLGGLGSVPGAVLGGFIVAALQTVSIVLGGSSYRNTVVFILLFVLLILRPQGLLGQARQDRA